MYSILNAYSNKSTPFSVMPSSNIFEEYEKLEVLEI